MDSSTHSRTPAVPAGVDPDELMAEAAEQAAGGDSLDEILRQIVGGYFVLTDGQGSVSKWSEPAELLFGRPAPEVLGQSFFQTLVKAPVPAAAETWRRFLEAGEAPSAAGRVEVSAVQADGHDFPMEAVFVPVKLDEGFDFSLFLEDLGFELPMNLMLQRMRAQHPVVVRAMRQALEPEPQPWEGWRTAGTLVVFRPLEATPWVEAELARREAARAEADAEVEERLTNIDPGIQGNSVADLDDAAAVVARLLTAMERIDELERVALSLPSQLEEARQSAERRAEAAEREAQALRAEVQRSLAANAGGGVDEAQHRELLARLERLEHARLDAEQTAHDRGRALDVAETARAELAARLDRLERQRAESSAAADARLATAVAEAQRTAEAAIAEAGRRADEARAAVEARIAGLELSGSGTSGTELTSQLELVRAEHEEAAQSARAELAATIEQLERDRTREAEAARADLAAALQRVEHVQREADALREQLTAVTVERAEAGEDRRRLDDLAREFEATRARIDTLRQDTVPARELEALRAEIAPLREGAAAIEAFRAELQSLQAASADLAGLRDQVEALHGGVPDLEPLREQVAAVPADLAALSARIDAVHAATGDLDALKARLDAGGSSADVEALRAELAAVREGAADLAALRSDIATLRAGAGEVESLRHDLGALRDKQEQVRGWLDEARRERDEFRAAGERTAAQVDELRRSLEERDSNPSIPVAQAAERDVVDALGGKVDALRGAEQALRMRLAELAAAGEATTRRIDELADLERALTGRLDELSAAGDNAARRVEDVRDDVVGRIDEVASASDATAAAVEEIRAAAADAAASAARAEALGADAAGTAARIDEVAAAGAATAGAIEEIRAAAARAEALAAEGADAARIDEVAEEGRKAVGELEQRLNEVDRGAGAVLSDVRGLRDKLDEVSTVAREAQEAVTGGRADAEELRASLARLGGEVEAARSQVEHARQEALGAREQAAAAGEAAASAREDAGRAREDAAAARRELKDGDEKIAALATDVERATEAAEAARADAATATKAGDRTTEKLADLDTTAQSLRTEMTASRERLEAVGGRVERLGRDVVEAGQASSAALEAQGTELRAELAAVRRIAEEAREGFETIRADIETVRDSAQSVREDAAAARSAAEAGDRKVEAMQAELTYALKQLEDVKAGLTSAGQAAVIARREAEQAKRAAAQSQAEGGSGVHEVFQQLLAAARGDAGSSSSAARLRRPQTPAQDLRRKSEAAVRAPRHGFDDASQPLALLGLDGRFRELNPAFARLVGYSEHAFAKAAWPSPHDRAGYQQQQDQLRQLASGEIESVSVMSTYMHGQGLMVPVVGTLKVVPGEDGLPLHLLLEAEERHTS